ncbi:hypothetical protein IWW48_005530 [Coemansia sp. RSA 1200]|nr:hypothetical protein IWW48_005530 [Coemansia sp. RSA 1200]
MPVIQLRSLPADIANNTGTTRFKAAVARIACDPPSAVVAAYDGGTVYACVDRLVYYSPKCERGFSLDYPSIVIHAVSSRDSSEDQDKNGPHLYCQLDAPFPGTRTDGAEGGQSDSGDAYDDEMPTELFFYPLDASVLDELFKAMSECSELNPGPNDSATEEEEQEEEEVSDSDPAILGHIASFDPSGFITSPDHLDRLTPEGRAVLAHLESVISASETSGDPEHGRFDDAPEEAH